MMWSGGSKYWKQPKITENTERIFGCFQLRLELVIKVRLLIPKTTKTRLVLLVVFGI